MRENRSAKIRPLRDVLVIEPLPQNDGTLIEIPDTAKGPPMRGRVIAAGPGMKYRMTGGEEWIPKMDVSIGDVVQFGLYAVDLEYDGLCLIREADVLVVECRKS